MNRIYTYGLIETGAVPLPAGLTGIADMPVELRAVRGFHAVVSGFPGEALRADRAGIVRHEKVLEAVLEHVTPLPFRFGAVVTEEQLVAFVDSFEGTLRADMDRVRGCVQMSVRLAVRMPEATTDTPGSPANPVPEHVEGPAAGKTDAPGGDAGGHVGSHAEGETAGPGTRFLRRKQESRRAVTAAAEWLSNCMSDLLRDRETNLAGRENMASIAHLIRRNDIGTYRTRFVEVTAARQDISALQTGPWPPYSFMRAGLADGPVPKLPRGLQYGGS